MRNKITLGIPKPCSEQWDNFTPAQNGGFCSSCSKIVVDFTKMDDNEILNLLNTKPAHACGRFRVGQLKTYFQVPHLKINPSLALFKAGSLSLLFLLLGKQSTAQTIPSQTKTEVVQHHNVVVGKYIATEPGQVIKGVITSEEDHLPLLGVSIYLKNAAEGTTSDIDGHFEFPRKLHEGDVLIFSFIGLETKEYVVPKKINDALKIQMVLDAVVMMGELAVDSEYTSGQSTVRTWWLRIKEMF